MRADKWQPSLLGLRGTQFADARARREIEFARNAIACGTRRHVRNYSQRVPTRFCGRGRAPSRRALVQGLVSRCERDLAATRATHRRADGAKRRAVCGRRHHRRNELGCASNVVGLVRRACGRERNRRVVCAQSCTSARDRRGDWQSVRAQNVLLGVRQRCHRIVRGDSCDGRIVRRAR